MSGFSQHKQARLNRQVKTDLTYFDRRLRVSSDPQGSDAVNPRMKKRPIPNPNVPIVLQGELHEKLSHFLPDLCIDGEVCHPGLLAEELGVTRQLIYYFLKRGQMPKKYADIVIELSAKQKRRKGWKPATAADLWDYISP
jgi:hypothetical protein